MFALHHLSQQDVVNLEPAPQIRLKIFFFSCDWFSKGRHDTRHHAALVCTRVKQPALHPRKLCR